MRKRLASLLAATFVMGIGSTTFASPTDNEWKFSGWAQTENTFGHVGIAGQPDAHEYVLEMRFAAEKQLNDKMHALYQVRTYTGYDQVLRGRADEDNRGTVETRQAWISYNSTPDTKFTFGKVILWDGFMHDDFLNGVTVDTKLGGNTKLFAATGRATVHPSTQVHTAILSTKAGDLGLSARYLTGAGPAASGNESGNIIGGTVDYTFENGPSLMVGFAEDTEAADGKDGKMTKVNLFKKIDGTDVTLRYEKQGDGFNTPIENTIHTAWWGDQYLRGIEGYRLIVGRSIAPDTYLEAFYGDYKTITDDEDGKKYGFSIQVSF
jgi:hypothetical protein